jgi:hypothetical protein
MEGCHQHQPCNTVCSVALTTCCVTSAAVELLCKAALGPFFQMGSLAGAIIEGKHPLSGRPEFRSFATLNLAWSGLVRLVKVVPNDLIPAIAQLPGDFWLQASQARSGSVCRGQAMHISGGSAKVKNGWQCLHIIPVLPTDVAGFRAGDCIGLLVASLQASVPQLQQSLAKPQLQVCTNYCPVWLAACLVRPSIWLCSV